MNQTMIVSHRIADAFVDLEAVRKVMPAADVSGYDAMLVAIYFVDMGTHSCICCLAGGRIEATENGPTPILTPIGQLTTDAARAYMSRTGSVHYHPIRCANVGKGRLTEQVQTLLRAARMGDLVVFVGDHVGACDGRILPALNIQGEAILMDQAEADLMRRLLN